MKTNPKNTKRIAACVFIALVLQSHAAGPDALKGVEGAQPAPQQTSEADAAAQANNPLAKMRAFSMQNYYIGRLTHTNTDANQFWFRYAQPLSLGKTNWLMRASLPVNTYPSVFGGHGTGLGDFNIFAAYLMDTGNPAVSFGFGPQLTAPTATRDMLGSGKWSAGLANVLFDARSKVFQWGYLLTWQHSFAGPSSRTTVNAGALQPFAFLQLGNGWYTGCAPIWFYDFENDNFSVPVGLRLGKVVKKGNTVFNFYLEPEYSLITHGPGQPDWQVFVGINMQFH